MDLQAELATCLGAKRFAFEQSMEVDEKRGPQIKLPKLSGRERREEMQGAERRRKRKRRQRRRRNSRTTSKVSQKSTGVWQAGSQSVRMVLCFSVSVSMRLC